MTGELYHTHGIIRNSLENANSMHQMGLVLFTTWSLQHPLLARNYRTIFATEELTGGPGFPGDPEKPGIPGWPCRMKTETFFTH